MRRGLVLLALLAGCSRGGKQPAVHRDAGVVVAPPVAVADARPVAEREAPLEGARVGTGPLVEDRIYDQYLVVMPRGAATSKVIDAVERTAKARGLRMIEGEGVAGGDRYLVVKPWSSPMADLAPEEVAFFTQGLSPEMVEVVNAANTAVMIELRADRAALDQGLIDVVECAIAGAEAVRAPVQDAETFQVFDTAMLRKLRGGDAPIDARRFTTIRVDPEHLDTFETAGMRRLGLPELTFRNVPQTVVGGVVLLTNAVAQYLVEHAQLPRDGELDLDLAALGTRPWPEVAAAVKRNGGSGTVTLTAIWATGSLGGAVIELSIPSRSPRPEAGYAKLGAVLGDVTDFDPGGSFAAMRE